MSIVIDPTFQVARIVYLPQLTRADARAIPLGSLAEVMLPHIHGLGLRARTMLKPAELELISPLIRERLADPFSFFRAEFDLAFDKAPIGHSIAFLAARHCSSLSVLAPTDYSKRSWLFGRALPPREETVDAQLSVAVDDEFQALMKQYGDPAAPDRKLIESFRAAA